jgi:hypothetical protein
MADAGRERGAPDASGSGVTLSFTENGPSGGLGHSHSHSRKYGRVRDAAVEAVLACLPIDALLQCRHDAVRQAARSLLEVGACSLDSANVNALAPSPQSMQIEREREGDAARLRCGMGAALALCMATASSSSSSSSSSHAAAPAVGPELGRAAQALAADAHRQGRLLLARALGMYGRYLSRINSHFQPAPASNSSSGSSSNSGGGGGGGPVPFGRVERALVVIRSLCVALVPQRPSFTAKVRTMLLHVGDSAAQLCMHLANAAAGVAPSSHANEGVGVGMGVGVRVGSSQLRQLHRAILTACSVACLATSACFPDLAAGDFAVARGAFRSLAAAADRLALPRGLGHGSPSSFSAGADAEAVAEAVAEADARSSAVSWQLWASVLDSLHAHAPLLPAAVRHLIPELLPPDGLHLVRARAGNRTASRRGVPGAGVGGSGSGSGPSLVILSAETTARRHTAGWAAAVGAADGYGYGDGDRLGTSVAAGRMLAVHLRAHERGREWEWEWEQSDEPLGKKGRSR